MALSTSQSSRTPSASIAASTSTSGISVSWNSGPRSLWASCSLSTSIELPGDVGVFGGIFCRPIGLHRIEADLPLARADQIGDGDRLRPEQLMRQRVHAVRSARRIEHEAGDHRVERDAVNRHAMPCQHDQVVLEVLPDFLDFGIGKDRPQRRRASVRAAGNRRRRRSAGKTPSRRPCEAHSRQFRADRARAAWFRCRTRRSSAASARRGSRRT